MTLDLSELDRLDEKVIQRLSAFWQRIYRFLKELRKEGEE